VSDLHLGTHTGQDVLRRPYLRAVLLEALSGVERLVLLGDVLELRHGPVRDALAAAQPVLGEIGEALGSGREVVLVPGNHDHQLLAAWFDRRGRGGPPAPLGLETAVDWRDGEMLAQVAAWLAPADVRVAYPGVWLRGDVYATHGHYGDRHTTVPMFERLGAGAMARIVGEPTGGPERVEDYEAILSPIYSWIHAIAQTGGPDLGRSSHGASAHAWRTLGRGSATNGGGRGGGLRRARGRVLIAGFPAVVFALNRAGLGPLRSDLSGAALRRGALRAFGEVLTRLRVDAPQVIFGHTHRAGPLPGDDRSDWHTPFGAQLMNTGSWVHEPEFLGPRPGESPYRAGFCVSVGLGGFAELRNLLDPVIAPAPA
jgi:hypothetical protein